MGISQNWSNGAYLGNVGLNSVRFNITPLAFSAVRDASFQQTLAVGNLSAKFQAGLLYEIRNPAVGNELLLSISPSQLSSTQAIFATTSVNLDNATVTQTVNSTSAATQFSWSDGTAGILTGLSLEVIWFFARHSDWRAVSFFGYTIQNGDIANLTMSSLSIKTAPDIPCPRRSPDRSGAAPIETACPTQPSAAGSAVSRGQSSGWWGGGSRHEFRPIKYPDLLVQGKMLTW